MTRKTTHYGTTALHAAILLLLVCAMPARAQLGFAFDAAFVLDAELEEISALSLGPEGQLLAVQDEEGYIYRLDPATGRIAQRDRFAGDGDYEGIEWVGEWIYVLESNGRLSRTPADEPSRNATKRIRLDLPGGCDAEGLAWDASQERFLVACKAADGVKAAEGRSVFAFTAEGKRRAEQFFVDGSAFKAQGVDGFRTSAVAVHPTDGRIFLLSSHPPSLCVLDAGEPSCERLLQETMRQPEGLAFDASGALWISSEARGQKPVLHRFLPAAK